jgi:hypothetical protein
VQVPSVSQVPWQQDMLQLPSSSTMAAEADASIMAAKAIIVKCIVATEVN